MVLVEIVTIYIYISVTVMLHIIEHRLMIEPFDRNLNNLQLKVLLTLRSKT